MNAEKTRWRLPGAGWLSAKLSRKMILILLAAAALGWLLSFSSVLSYLRAYVGETYDRTMAQAQEQARQVASFLEGSQGNCSGLEEYLTARQLGCSIQDSKGTVLFQFMPEAWTDARLAVSSGASVSLRSGETLRLYVWSSTLSRQNLSDAVGHRAFVGLAVFNLTMFVVAGVMLYLLIVSPIIGLRKTMREYSEKGTLPPRSLRMDEVGKLQNTFADLTGVLKAKEQSERRLIASISHDIKTPLTSVLGYSERLLSASLSPEKRERYLHSIHDKGLAIQSIVDEFDDYLEAGLRDEAPMELLSVQTLCDSLRQEYQAELLDANVRLNIRCTCPRAELICNQAHMRRYFGNLIGNSIQHSGAEHLELEMLCRQESKELMLEFWDNGNGVPDELLQQIFEPLYTTDRGRKVSGLGLSICRSIIRAQGGTVSAENRPQGGLLVRAVLPCANC
ncbi:MAG: HAMP domain-containing sensor histidine kinase [Lawsonibacter sp.]|nr:HAMP domain-containing sensor histidine kinase [Lawsonibacter sp.]